MKKDIYRKAALERLATVDQLDKVMKITSPLSWIALAGVTAMLLAVLYWACFMTLPITVTAPGAIVSVTAETNSLRAPASGTLTILVREGDHLVIGQPYAMIRDTKGNEITCKLEDQTCYVSTILVSGGRVDAGMEIIRISPEPFEADSPQVAVCYVPMNYAEIFKMPTDNENYTPEEDAKKGTVTIENDTSNSSAEVVVINMDTGRATPEELAVIFGKDSRKASQITENGDVFAVTCALWKDSEENLREHDAKNPYIWSKEEGSQFEFNRDYTPCTVRLVISEEKPIFMLFNKLRDIWEGKSR